MTSGATGLLRVDLGALAHNYRLLKDRAGPRCRVAGVVKADAYGLGLAPVVRALEREDCPSYFVATFGEALALRELTPKPVAVLNGVFAESADEAIDKDITPVLNSLPAIEDWSAAARRREKRAPAILHFDTGMNRLGLGADETARLLAAPEKYAGLEIRTVMTHFACADEEHNLTPVQFDRFRGIAARFPGVAASAANSAALFRDDRYRLDLARPGMALYGLNPTPDKPNPMKQVVALTARILQVREARAGETVGYGAAATLPHDSRLATVALGYADGFPRSLSGQGKVYLHGHLCPVVGRVSMDLTVIELGGLPARPGDNVEILGPHQGADDLATQAGTIGYEILTSLRRRYKREYI